MSNSILNCVNFFVNFCRIFDYIYLIVTLLILKIHSSCPLKPLQVPPYALKTDSFQGLRPWTLPGGLQRPQTPSWSISGGLRPPDPLPPPTSYRKHFKINFCCNLSLPLIKPVFRKVGPLSIKVGHFSSKKGCL